MANTMVVPMVVGVDGTGDSLVALAAAAAMVEESGAELVVVHVRHETGLSGAGIEASAASAMTEALDELEATSRERVADVLAGRTIRWRFEVASGDPATKLMAAARRYRASTIVVGGRSHGIVGGLVVGSVAQKLVRQSSVSVLVVRDGQAHRMDVASSSQRVGD